MHRDMIRAMDEPHLYSTTDWGARPPTEASFARHKALGACIHHAVVPNRDPLPPELEIAFAYELARKIQADHMDNRQYADTGQHFTISRGGIIVEGRHGTCAAARAGEVVKGAHAGDPEGNTRWFGIELEGRYDKEFVVTEQQWKALIELLAWLSLWGGYAPSSIRGHRDFKATACPGLVYDHLDELRSAVEDRWLRLQPRS